jgi:hypothetical protein
VKIGDVEVQKDQQADFTVVWAKAPFQKFRFTMKGPGRNGGWIMRVGKIELRGFFIGYGK